MRMWFPIAWACAGIKFVQFSAQVWGAKGCSNRGSNDTGLGAAASSGKVRE